MAELVIEWIEDAVVQQLERRAKNHGCSLEELVRDILRDAAKDTRPSGGLGSQIAARLRGRGLISKSPNGTSRSGRPLFDEQYRSSAPSIFSSQWPGLSHG